MIPEFSLFQRIIVKVLCFAEDTLGSSKSGSYTYTDDTMTTNLYLGNINPKVCVWKEMLIVNAVIDCPLSCV